jgi:LPXTG-motif cell wall-anchored protein
MKLKKTIIALLLAVSIFLLNMPQVTVTAADNNLFIQVGEKTTFEEGTLLIAAEDLPSKQYYSFSENSNSVAQYDTVLGNRYEGYLLPGYSQLSSEYKTALQASGYVLPEDGEIKWVVERKEDKTVAEETIGMDGPETYYRDFPVYKIYPYILYDVSINTNIANGSIVADKPNATSGETVTLTLSPNAHCQSESISVKDKNNNEITLSGTGNTRTFTMPESNVSVDGSFSKLPYNIEVDSSITNGSIVADKSMAIAGEIVTLTISPDDEYELIYVYVKDASDNNIPFSAEGNKITLTMPESNVSITGGFSKVKYNIEVDSNIANGSIVADKSMAIAGETVTLTASPNDKYQLGGITVKDGNDDEIPLSGTGNTRTFTMPKWHVSVTGSFSKIPGTVESVILSPALITVQKGGIQAFTVSVNGTNDPEQSVKWSIEGASSNNTTISEGGALKVGSDEMSPTLIIRGTSTLDNSKSGVSIVNVIRANIKPDSSANMIFGINEGDSYIVGKEIGFEAIGGGMNNTTPISDDTRYIPKSWSINTSSEWTTAPYTAKLTIDNSGNYTLIVSYQKQVYDGVSWQDIVNEMDTKTVSFNTIKNKYPITIDQSIVNGDIVVDKINATSGETVTLTITPANQYKLESIIVKDGNNNAITLSGTGNTRTFIMPESSVSVTGGFSKIPAIVENVVLTPETVTVQKGKTQAFTAIVNGPYSPDQSVKWSVEGASSKDTTISESGILQVSSDEMSSTLKVRATSTLDNTKSSVAVVKVIRANIIPDAASNTISGIKEGTTYIVGTEIGFSVIGGGMDNTAPISGDQRYVPTSWSVNPHGEWTEAPYTAKFTINHIGNFTLKVLYQKQNYNGTSWDNIANEIDTKTVSFSVIDKQTSKQSETNDNTTSTLPITGDNAKTLLFLFAGIIAAVSAGYMYLTKKKRVEK